MVCDGFFVFMIVFVFVRIQASARDIQASTIISRRSSRPGAGDAFSFVSFSFPPNGARGGNSTNASPRLSSSGSSGKTSWGSHAYTPGVAGPSLSPPDVLAEVDLLGRCDNEADVGLVDVHVLDRFLAVDIVLQHAITSSDQRRG